MIVIPEVLDKCVKGLMKKGKSKSSAFAICTASLKKSGKMEEVRDPEDKPKTQKFSFPFPELDSAKLSDSKTINIQMLKKGTFRHPWYGVMRFNDEFFDKVIGNFNLGIPLEEISFDFKHSPDWGAAAWVKGLSKTEEGLFGEVELTNKGRESIKSKEFRYFSTEFTDEYVEYVFQNEKDEKGGTVEKEYRLNFGPVIYGGGLTNRPFIKGMKPVSLDEEGGIEDAEMEEINDESILSEEVNEAMAKTLEELRKSQEELEAKIKELQEKDPDKSKDKVEKLTKELGELKDKVEVKEKKAEEDERKRLSEEDRKKLEDAEKKADDATKELGKIKEENKKALEDVKKDSDEKVKELEGSVKTLTESVTKLMTSRKTLEDKGFTDDIDKKLEEFKKLGVFPSVIDVVKPVLLSEENRSFTVKLSEGEGDEKKEVKKTLADILFDAFSAIPEDYRFSEDESSESVISPTGSGKSLSEDDVQKYADEKKITYGDALIELSKEGKIE